MLSIPKAFDVQLWFARVDDTHTTIWAQFKDINPKEEDVEINVRQSVFYPDKPGRNYITVRGFTMMHAATNWVPPTAEQGHTRHPDAQWFPDAGLGLFLDWEAESI
jgi:alpha-N-arabinofuranosidase